MQYRQCDECPSSGRLVACRAEQPRRRFALRLIVSAILLLPLWRHRADHLVRLHHRRLATAPFARDDIAEEDRHVGRVERADHPTLDKTGRRGEDRAARHAPRPCQPDEFVRPVVPGLKAKLSDKIGLIRAEWVDGEGATGRIF